jgi:hypothetical protein
MVLSLWDRYGLADYELGRAISARTRALPLVYQRLREAQSAARPASHILVGNVNVSALGKTRIAKSVLDACWSLFRTMLQYKCDYAGVWLDEVDEAYSTQTGSCCIRRTWIDSRNLAGKNLLVLSDHLFQQIAREVLAFSQTAQFYRKGARTGIVLKGAQSNPGPACDPPPVECCISLRGEGAY